MPESEHEPEQYLSLCKPVAEVRMIEATLSLEGYSPFVCDAEDPPDDSTRYLRQTITANRIADERFVLRQTETTPVVEWGPIGSGEEDEGRNTTQEQRDIDPFTGIVCTTGDVGFTISTGFTEDEEECTETQRVFTASPITDPCDEENEIEREVRYTLSQPYTIEDVADNVDTAMFFFLYSDLPANTKGVVLSGTGGTLANSTLAWEDAGLNWSAVYEVNDNTVTKRKVQVTMLQDANITIRTTDSEGESSDEVIEAQKGQVIEYDPPSEPGKIEVFACQGLSECLLPKAEADYSSVGKRLRRIANPEFDGCELFYVSADGRLFEKKQTTIRTVVNGSGSLTETGDVGLEDPVTGTRTYSAQIDRTTETIRTPCNVISVTSTGGGSRSFLATENGTVLNKCDATVDADGTEIKTPTGCNILDSRSDYIDPSLFTIETTQEGKISSCLCVGELEIKVYSPAFSGVSGSGIVENGNEIFECEEIQRVRKSIVRESITESTSVAPGESSGATWNVDNFTETTEELTDELIDPFGGDTGIDDEEQPEDVPDETCAQYTVSTSNTVQGSIEEIEWEIAVAPSPVTDSEGEPLEHTLNFQYVVSELDTENPYCHVLKFESFEDKPLDERVPTEEEMDEGYEVEKQAPDLTVDRARLQRCIIHESARVEVEWEDEVE